jgi:hypothetical protein
MDAENSICNKKVKKAGSGVGEKRTFAMRAGWVELVALVLLVPAPLAGLDSTRPLALLSQVGSI